MERDLEQMTFRKKLGQCFAVGFPGTALSEEFKAFLKEYKVGNVILFRENITDLAQLDSLCSQIRQLIVENTGHEPFIMIDQEGGAIVRFSDDAVNVPGAMAIAATKNPANAFLAGQLTGRQLYSLGINFDLAPVMDINCNPDNPVIGIRSYGDKPDCVSEYAMEMARGLLSEGVLACAKHFPGHGDTGQDSHLSLPVVNKPFEELEKMELVPFRQAVKEKIPAVMTTHILFPALEEEKVPATMSKKILTGLLREKFGFEGLILSDCMEMGAIKKYYGTAPGTLAAFRAGVDLVLISHTPAAAAEAFELVEKEAAEDEELKERIRNAAGRVLFYKKKYEQKEEKTADTQEDRQQAYRLLKKTLVTVSQPFGKIPQPGEKPFFAGCYAYRITLAANVEDRKLSFPDWMAEKLGGSSCLFSPDPDENEIAEIAQKAAGHSSIVVGTYNAHLKRGQKALVERLAKSGVPVVVFALRNPYDLKDLPENVTAIAAWEYSVRSFRAIAEVLRGEWTPEGSMPVAWETGRKKDA